MAKRKTAIKTKTGSLADFAKAAKISRPMVTKLRIMGVLDGALIEQPGKKRVLVDINKALKFYNERVDPNFRKTTRFRSKPIKKKEDKKGTDDNGQSKREKSGGQSYIDARSISEQYKAAKLKLEYEINKGVWVKRDDVANMAFKAARLMRDNLLNIPARTSALVASESKQKRCYKIIHDEVKQALDEYVRKLESITK